MKLKLPDIVIETKTSVLGKIKELTNLVLAIPDFARDTKTSVLRKIKDLTSYVQNKINVTKSEESKYFIRVALVVVIIGGGVFLVRRKLRKNYKDDIVSDCLMKGIVIVSDPNGKLIPKIDKKLVKVCKLEKNEVLIRVKSVSVDPVDIRILQGHGQSILSRLSKTTKSLNANIVLIPGRDCAGIVEMVGENVLEFKTGDQVWAYSAPWQNGLMSEFSKVHEDNVAFKPENATFENSCSVAYAGLITWDALVNQAGLTAETAENKRVLIHLGSCAIGALAIQMVKLWGAHVTTTVPTLGLPLVRFLGADDVIVYSVSNFEEELRSRKKWG